MGTSEGSLTQTFTGVTHTHTTAAKDRIYYMHFVRLTALKPRAKYYYTVQSGASDAVVSQVFNFRSPYGPEGGETKGGKQQQAYT
jgi:phosphodiesterase/alkaline phosphatase D-like protein